MSNQINPAKKSLTIKDLVTTGIFSAIFLVFTMIGGIFFAPNPVLTFYMPMGAALLCGPVYLLMIAKVQKRWSVTILGIIMGIIWFVTGMHWAFSLGYIGMGIIADLVAGAGDYRNKAVNLLSYMLMSLGGVYTYVVFFIDPQGWASTMLENVPYALQRIRNIMNRNQLCVVPPKSSETEQKSPVSLHIIFGFSQARTATQSTPYPVPNEMPLEDQDELSLSPKQLAWPRYLLWRRPQW